MEQGAKARFQSLAEVLTHGYRDTYRERNTHNIPGIIGGVLQFVWDGAVPHSHCMPEVSMEN